MPHRHRLIAGVAGLGYVVGAAVENMGLLEAPLLGAGQADVRAAHVDHALGVIGSAAGALSLAAYLVFAWLVCRRWVWAAVAGAALAFVGVVASFVMVWEPTVGLSELALSCRYVAGPFMGLFLLGAGARWFAAPLFLTPLALSEVRAVQVGAILAFGLHSLWISLASLRLLYGRVDIVRRSAFLLLVVAASAVGFALLAVPEATGTFFAWGLAPSGLAAFSGGVYVGAAVVYAAGLRLGPRASRPLLPGAVVLSVSVLIVTLVHLEVFDLSRLQAWAWLALFSGFAGVTVWLTVTDRGPDRRGVPLDVVARVTFGVAAVVLAAVAIALWADPRAFDLPPLGGRFAGSWSALLATLSCWALWRNDRDEAVLPALALIALPLGALAGAARVGSFDALSGAYVAIAVVGALAAAGTVSPQTSRGATAVGELPVV